MMQRRKSLRTWMGALTVIALLAAWPAMVGADDTTMPPQLNWIQFPPASHPIDSKQLVEFLQKKG